MTNAVSGYGTLLQVDDGVGNYTTVAEVKDITGPGYEADTIEATNHSSAGAWREWLAGLLDGGEVTFDVNYIPSNPTHDESASGLFGLLLNRTRRNFRLVWPVTPVERVTFLGMVTGFEPSAPVDDVLTASITIKVSGQPSFA